MHGLLRGWIACAAVFWSVSLHAQIVSAGLPPPFTKSLQKVHVPPEALGVFVQEISSPTESTPPWISWQADLPMQPASTMKLVTSYAALRILGPAYTWKTSVYTNGHMEGDVLIGDLILQGGGDPHLVLENFWTLLRQIRQKGVREIHGNLIIDNSWMEAQHFDAADFDGDPTRPYNVGPDALLVNFNVLTLQLHPDANGLQISTLTPLALQIKADVHYAGGTCGEWRNQLKPVFTLVDQQINLHLSGSYPKSCGDKTWSLQPYPLTHADFDGALFRALWLESGGRLDGVVRIGTVAPDAELLTILQSESLPDILREINKYSNNVMTRLVMLTIDKETSQLPANQQRAGQLLQRWFDQLRIGSQGLQLENGSGLSRTERISASQMGQMLNLAFASPLMPEYLSSLPLLGVDGTMQKRARNFAVAGHAHIKSGGLDGVRNFAGYVLAASGKRYVVVCFVNHNNAHQTEAAQDELLQWIYEHG